MSYNDSKDLTGLQQHQIEHKKCSVWNLFAYFDFWTPFDRKASIAIMQVSKGLWPQHPTKTFVH